MCGLLGLAFQKGSSLTPEVAGLLLSQLALKNETRGGDSFGMGVVVPEEKDIRLFKSVGKISRTSPRDPSWSGGITRVLKAIQQNQTTVVIGHNRKATTGANTQRNAHPFLCGKPSKEFVVGAHNGVLPAWEDVAAHWEIAHDIEVDSEIIFRGIQKFQGEDQGDVRVLGQLVPLGSLAVSYMTNYDKLHLYRGDNPLSIVVGEGFVLWSSIWAHLQDVVFGLHTEELPIRAHSKAVLDLSSFTLEEVEVPRDQSLRRSLFPERTHQPGMGHWRGGHKVIAGDRRSSTEKQRAEATKEHERYQRLFGTAKKPDTKVHKASTEIVSLKDYRESLVHPMPRSYVLHPRSPDIQKTCSVCHGYNGDNEEPETFEDWEFLWKEGDAFCPVCYYYLVQSEAESHFKGFRGE